MTIRLQATALPLSYTGIYFFLERSERKKEGCEEHLADRVGGREKRIASTQYRGFRTAFLLSFLYPSLLKEH